MISVPLLYATVTGFLVVCGKWYADAKKSGAVGQPNEDPFDDWPKIPFNCRRCRRAIRGAVNIRVKGGPLCRDCCQLN